MSTVETRTEFDPLHKISPTVTQCHSSSQASGSAPEEIRVACRLASGQLRQKKINTKMLFLPPTFPKEHSFIVFQKRALRIKEMRWQLKLKTHLGLLELASVTTASDN